MHIIKYFIAIIFLIIPLYNILFTNIGMFINGGDTDWYFNAKLFFNRSLYNWWDISLGLQNNFHFTGLYSLLQYTISLFLPDNNFVGQRIFILIYFILIFIFSYKLVSFLINYEKKKHNFSIDSFLISLFYFYNIVFFFFIHHIQFKTLIFYTFLPIITYFLLIYIKNGKPFHLFTNSIAILIFIPSLGHFQMFLLFYFLILIFTYLFYQNKTLKIKLIKRLTVFTFITLILIFSFLLPATLNQLTSRVNDLSVNYSSDALQNRNNDFLNSLQFVGGYGWKFYDKDYFGRQSFEYRNLFKGVGSIFLLLPVILLLSVFFLNKYNKDKSLLYLLLIILSLIFFSGPVYLKLNTFLPNIISIVFRSFFNFYMIAPIFLLITFAILYQKFIKTKSFILITLLIYYLGFFYIILTGQLINKFWYINEVIALSYTDYITEINKDRTLFRVINEIPNNQYNPVYVSYDNYFIGPDYYFTLLNNALISNYSHPSLNQNSLNKSRNIIDFKRYSDPNVNIKYIIKSDSIILNNKFYPRIFAKGVSFQKINPTKYKLNIKNLNTKQDLSFLESFHKDWKLYLKPNSINSWCKPIEYYENNKTTECKHTQKFFEGEELSYLYKKPVFNESHKVVNEYANGWTIDPEYIKQNFSKDYYKENPDGSIDIEMVLYFKPQSYFYLGLIISGTTLLGCFGYLIYDWRKRRKVYPVK